MEGYLMASKAQKRKRAPRGYDEKLVHNAKQKRRYIRKQDARLAAHKCPHCNGTGTLIPVDIPSELIDAAYIATTIPLALMLSQHRHQRIVQARMLIVQELRWKYKWSLGKIAGALNKHYSTLVHYEAKHYDYMKYDIEYSTKYTRFISELGTTH